MAHDHLAQGRVSFGHAVLERPGPGGGQDRIVGGAIPRKFIPAVGEAAEEASRKGPLGNPVVDIAVALLDGAFHSVDSSDMAFATATRMAMQEALAKANAQAKQKYEKALRQAQQQRKQARDRDRDRKR